MNLLLGIIAFCILAILYARFIEPNLLIVRKIRIKSPRSINSGKPLRITLLSDFHFPRLTNDRFIRRAIEKSNQFEPDLVFLLGDFFDKRKKDPAVLPDNVKSVFGDIHSRLGVFGVLGNHDHWFDEQAIRKVLKEETSIVLIDNSSVPIEMPGNSIYIAGVGDLRTKNAHYDQTMRNIPQDASVVLLSHNPDVVEEISDPRIFIQFSGHTHGGQIRLPFIGALRVPSKFGNKYSRGLSATGNHLLYANSGICSTLVSGK